MLSRALAAPPRSLARWTVDTRRLDAGAVALGGLVLFAMNADFLMRGDASMYADYVLQGKFDELTLHLGYYLALYALHHTVGAALGLPVQELLVWTNVALGALTLAVAYALARELLGDRRDALLCAALLAVCGRVVANATTSEVYMMQTFLVLSSFLLFVRERAAAAGVVGALALLVSPLSVFAYLFYPVLDHQRAGRVRWGVLARTAGAALAVYLPYLALFGHELLWGRRGLLVIDASTPLELSTLLARLPLYYFKHYTLLLLLLVPALLALRERRRLLALTLAVALPHLYIVANLTSEDHVFLLSTDFFFACWLAVGWRRLASARRLAWLAPLPLAAHLALAVGSGALFHGESHRGYADEMGRIARTYLAGRDAALVSDWDVVMTLTFHGRDSVTSTVERDPLFRQMVDITALYRETPHGLQAAELYLLDPWEPGPLKRLLSPPALIERQRQQHGVLAKARRTLDLDCTLLERGTHPLYRCVRRGPAAGAARDAPPPAA